jgi:chromosome segregation ATPase
MKKKENLTATVASLTTGRRSDKRYIGTLERRAEKMLKDCTRMEGELNASRRECGQLVKSAETLEKAVTYLEQQCYHLQKLITHTAAVTVWKVLEE